MRRLFRQLSTRRSLPPHLLVPFPRLSHHMRDGVLQAWSAARGQRVDVHDILCTVEASLLPDEPPAVVELESHEEGFVAKLLCQAGDTAEPDQPIAILVELEEDIAAFATHTPPPETRVPAGHFCWQAYIKSGRDTRECGANGPER